MANRAPSGLKLEQPHQVARRAAVEIERGINSPRTEPVQRSASLANGIALLLVVMLSWGHPAGIRAQSRETSMTTFLVTQHYEPDETSTAVFLTAIAEEI